MGCDHGATISLDRLIAIPSSQGIEGNISQLNNHVCYSCGVAKGNQYQIKLISLLCSPKKMKTKTRCSGAISHLKNLKLL